MAWVNASSKLEGLVNLPTHWHFELTTTVLASGIMDRSGLRGQMQIFSAAVQRLKNCLDPEEKEKRQPFLQQLKEDRMSPTKHQIELIMEDMHAGVAVESEAFPRFLQFSVSLGGRDKNCRRTSDFE